MYNSNSYLKLLPVGLMLIAAVGCSEKQAEPAQPDFTSFVDTSIGTGGHGHVFVGANVPFGYVQLGPTSIPQSWDWCSGYHVSDSTVIGFPHTHLSGTGIGDLHDITLMPVTGSVTYARGVEEDPASGLWSYADRSRQTSRPGYFSTHLSRYDVDVELTATKRVGFHKYTFNKPDSAAVVIDLVNGGTWDRPVQAFMKEVGDSIIEGYRYSKGWANDQRVYFVAQFSQPFTSVEFIADDKAVEGDSATATKLFARANFDLKADESVYVKVALSPVSISNAYLNLSSELPGWDFEATVADANKAWNDELSKISISTSDDDVRKIFYTALYHSMIAPSEFCDVNGDYYGADLQNHPGEGFTNYTTLSLWDTYRAANPLMTIIHPEKMEDFARTLVTIHKQQGKLPVWHLMGNETNCMVGNSGVPVLADAILKGYVANEEEAYQALKESMMNDERGMKARKQYGYIPFEEMNENVAFDMEYAIDDWAVAQVARKLGHDDDYKYFLDRSHSYRKHFDPATGFMRGVSKDGKFHEPFSPISSNHREDDYCEGNAWQYTFLAPHDLDGLIECFGSKEAFISKLDSLFVVDSTLEGEDISPDISGLIGQYAHGNEPSHHITYFYTMAGQPEKTADLVRRIMKEQYTTEVDGLSGNEDVGQMSSWYILSALGLYQVEPAGGRYFFGSPIVDEAVIKVKDGDFTIKANNNSEENRYIQSITLNGQPYTKEWIDFADIAAGGILVMEMGPTPAKWY